VSSEALPAAAERLPASMRTVVIVSACGVASMALLATALVFAHHWGALTDMIVAGWAAATVASARGVWLLADRRAAGGRSRIAFRIAAVAVLATLVVLLGAGVAWATGGDPASCGGG
jgi:hypothetical protein